MWFNTIEAIPGVWYRHRVRLLLAGLLLWPATGFCQLPVAIDNPVLPGVADAGVIRFNGEYYIGGVFTNGSFYKSRDLLRWEGPVHVFSMDNDWTSGPSADDSQIHANDITYVNGVFHQYWSVNYWGSDQHVVHIGHATASQVLGPYKEPVKESWMDNRIDPKLFVDDDGIPYLYMVKFTDGNTIWGRRMKDPSTFSGEPKYLFSSLPDTWETADNRVAEGPWVIKYRNRYYLMYNANHTSTSWGNYALGVAEAAAPLAFNHGNKYPHPVVNSNQGDLEDDFADLLKYTGTTPGIFQYTLMQPGKDWSDPNFNASGWRKGKAGFGSVVVKNSTARTVHTTWQTPEIWVRKSFEKDKDTGDLLLRIHHDGETKVFLNGDIIYDHPARQYTTVKFDKRTASLLKDGENVLAVNSKQGARTGFLDVSLFDLKDSASIDTDILYSPGQPNIVRGPNGFEWWLIYMANRNAEKRGQFINRIHFFDKKLYADGITSSKTPGYHPGPSQPTFSDLFNEGDAGQLKRKWTVKQGTWSYTRDELVQADSRTALALINAAPAEHYLFEAGIKMSNGNGKAGICAWWQDDNNFLKIVFDQREKTWAYVLVVDGKTDVCSFPLPFDFNYEVYHLLRVFKNATNFTVQIDDRPAPGNATIGVATFAGKGLPGLCSEGGRTAFDGVIYTAGWDEFDTAVAGWSPSLQGTDKSGVWSVSKHGISQTQKAGLSAAFKGDFLEQYDFGLQITSESSNGSAGIYPIYIDDNNYLKAVFDFRNQRLVITGKLKGSELENRHLSLKRTTPYYADMRYTDFIEKHFTLEAPAVIDGVVISKIPHGQPDTLINDLYKKLNISYRLEGRWHPLTSYREKPSGHPAFDKIVFDPVKAEALRFINRKGDDHHAYVYKIRVDEVFKQSYNLRVVRSKEHIIFHVDGKEVLRMKHTFSASQVGLITENTTASFNGITLFHIGPDHEL